MKNTKKLHLLQPIVYNNKVKIFDIKYNPVYDYLSIVDLEGKLKFVKINQEEKKVEKLKNFKISNESVYSVDFSQDGENVLCGTSDGELVMIQGSKIKMRRKAHEKTINSVKFLNRNVFSSSDETGIIKIFDMRSKREIFEFKEQEEEITDMEFHQNLLLASCIDGTLGVYDIRKEGKYKLHALSDNIEDELYCMRIVRGGQKVACGTSEGPIALFNWDWFGDLKDRIMGHPGSVNSLEKYNENILITGCEDGGIRFVSVNPKFIHSMITDISGVKTNKGFNDVNVVTLDKDKKFLACCTNIDYVKFYDISKIEVEIEENQVSENEDENENENSEVDDEISENSKNEEDEEQDEFSQDEQNQEINNINNDNNEEEEPDSYIDSDSDSSCKKKDRKTDKTLKLTSKGDSTLLIQKERRKEFFGDI